MNHTKKEEKTKTQQTDKKSLTHSHKWNNPNANLFFFLLAKQTLFEKNAFFSSSDRNIILPGHVASNNLHYHFDSFFISGLPKKKQKIIGISHAQPIVINDCN